MKRICFVLFLSLLLVFALGFHALAANRTQADAVAWVNARLSEKWAVDYDGANGCQDIDLIKYYFDYLGASRINGYAYTYVNCPLPNGWSRSYVPGVGDIAVWGANVGIAGQYGHVGIVTKVSGSNITYVATNDGAVQCTSHTLSRYNCSIFIHPSFLVNGSLDVNWRIDGSDINGGQSAGTVDVYVNGVLQSNDCSDYYADVPYGASYEIRDIRASSGYTYLGVASGSLTGYVGEDTAVRLSFAKNSAPSGGAIVIITGNNVPVRSYASTSASRLGTVANDTGWSYMGSTIQDERGVDWYSISYYGKTGWVSSKLSSFKGNPEEHSYGDKITIVNGDTNIRQAPALSGKLLGVAYKNTVWTYLGQSAVDTRGITWYLISYKSASAWISSKYSEFTQSSSGWDDWSGHSSYHVSQSAYLTSNTPKVDGEKAFDGKSDTCWCVSESNNSFGQWVQIDYAKSRSVTGFTIINGYDKVRGSNDYWKLNCRVSTLAVYCDGAYIGLYSLKDSRSPQTISFGHSVTGSTFRFVIRGVYGGSKYADVCISEISLY